MVSVIIPVYNRKDFLKLTLDSISYCDTVLKEIIIVDDGSQEDIRGMLMSDFSNLNYKYIKIPNQGAAIARNEGIFHTKSEYILFLDSDDLVEKNFFVDRINFLESNPNLDAVYGPWDHVTSSSTIQNYTVIPRVSSYPIYDLGNEDLILKNLLAGWYINQCSILWRKKIIENLNGFTPSLIINQDVDLVFRAIINKVRLAGANLPKTLYRDHDQLRVGKVDGNETKLKQILNLRKFFAEELEKNQMFTIDLKEELAYYLFSLWTDIRKDFPKLAQEFLDFADEIKPDLKVRGGSLYILLAKILGKKKATIFKQIFK